METNPLPKTARCARRAGFTLIETATAMMIISVAVVAMCGLLAAGTAVNVSGNELTTGVRLSGAIHEMALGLPLDEQKAAVIRRSGSVWDLNGRTFSPPIDGGGLALSDHDQWSQQVMVQTVDTKDAGVVRPNDRSAPAARMTVTVYHAGHYVNSQSWVLAADDAPLRSE